MVGFSGMQRGLGRPLKWIPSWVDFVKVLANIGETMRKPNDVSGWKPKSSVHHISWLSSVGKNLTTAYAVGGDANASGSSPDNEALQKPPCLMTTIAMSLVLSEKGQ